MTMLVCYTVTMKKIVTIGGGTGSFTLLSGLRKYPFDITAVVTMADDGGSTGVLRDELGVLPPGDVRQCLVALSEESATLRALLNYRFERGGLEGHNFGNVMLSALEKITGSFSAGVEEAARILHVRGRVVPVSESDMRLRITLRDGTVVEGESHLDDNALVRTVGIASVALAGRVRACKDAVAAINTADLVVIGPGDHFGSIVPNLLVRGVTRAIKETKAQVVFVAPLTNKRGHTEGFSVENHVIAVEKYIGRGRVDFVIVNTRRPSARAVARYEAQEGEGSLVLLCNDANAVEDTWHSVRGDFLNVMRLPRGLSADKIATTRSFIRHDPDALARAVALVAYRGQREIEIV